MDEGSLAEQIRAREVILHNKSAIKAMRPTKGTFFTYEDELGMLKENEEMGALGGFGGF